TEFLPPLLTSLLKRGRFTKGLKSILEKFPELQIRFMFWTPQPSPFDVDGVFAAAAHLTFEEGRFYHISSSYSSSAANQIHVLDAAAVAGNCQLVLLLYWLWANIGQANGNKGKEEDLMLTEFLPPPFTVLWKRDEARACPGASFPGLQSKLMLRTLQQTQLIASWYSFFTGFGRTLARAAEKRARKKRAKEKKRAIFESLKYLE
ncbi:hypothetical protein TYRP_014719, partial [Tyrophagus putrescentiae]